MILGRIKEYTESLSAVTGIAILTKIIIARGVKEKKGFKLAL